MKLIVVQVGYNYLAVPAEMAPMLVNVRELERSYDAADGYIFRDVTKSRIHEMYIIEEKDIEVAKVEAAPEAKGENEEPL